MTTRDRLVRTDDGWQRVVSGRAPRTIGGARTDADNDTDDETRRLREHLRDAHMVVASMAQRLVAVERALHAHYC